MERTPKTQLHSIVVPVYESKEMIETLVQRVSCVLSAAGLHFELVLVDDGSKDESFEEIKRLSSMFPFIRGFRLSRNFGHQAALTIGLRESRGAFVAIIDDDLQDPPEVLPRFFEKLYEGSDVVYGVRTKRKEGIFKRFLYSAFYRVLNFLSHTKIPFDSGDFCTMSRRVVDAMLHLPEANTFLRGIRSWVGFKQIGLQYERSARLQGESGYTLHKYLKLAMTGILMFSYVPLRIATYLGIVTSVTGFLYALVIITYWLLFPFEVPGYLSLIVVITLLGGVQLISIGIIGQYIARLNDNSRKWPVAFVAERTEVDKP